MKNASSALLALLNSDTFIMADLFTFDLPNGITVRLTSADGDLTVDGNVFSAARIKRGRVRVVCGVEVDTLEITIYTNEGDSVGGISFITSLNLGALDGAHVTLERVFMPTFGDTSAGTVILFGGRVADLQFGRSETRLQVKSDLELLNIQMPRNLYQVGCLHTLFDAGCALSKASFGDDNTAAAGATATAFRGSQTKADDYYAAGTVTFTSGWNAGASYTVKSYASGVFTLLRPTLYVAALGDAFTAYPGCDKAKATCADKFSNVIHFRGYPYIPPPETAY